MIEGVICVIQIKERAMYNRPNYVALITTLAFFATLAIFAQHLK